MKQGCKDLVSALHCQHPGAPWGWSCRLPHWSTLDMLVGLVSPKGKAILMLRNCSGLCPKAQHGERVGRLVSEVHSCFTLRVV